MTNATLEHCLSFVNSQSMPDARSEKIVRRAVTISRQAGCGALEVARKLAAYLQEHSSKSPVPLTVFDRNLIDKVLEDHNLPAFFSKYMPDDRISQIEDTVADIFGFRPPVRTVVRQTTETILKLAELGNVILIGRGATVITARVPRVLHIRLVAPLDDRVARIRQTQNLGATDARAFCVREDKGRERFLKIYFNANINDPLLYHLVINTSKVGYDAAAKTIGDAVLNLH